MTLLLSLLSLSAHAGDDESARLRLERRTERRAEKATELEDRWVAVCKEVELAPDDPRVLRELGRAESQLIGARTRHVCFQSQLEAWEAPEDSVTVLYATNRERREGRHGAEYLARDADRLEYGLATVRIPERHPAGELDRGLQVVSIEPLAKAEFERRLALSVEHAGPGATVLTYVHGYNNSFDYAARRTAQIAHDVHRPVVPVMYAWPAAGGTMLGIAKYTFDENAAARSSPLLVDLFESLVETGAPQTVIAHSMGSRVVSDAILDLDRRLDADGPVFEQLVLAAPDVDSSVFARRYLEPTLDAAGRLTVYCASDDRALLLSRSVHGGYDRLGSCRTRATDRIADPRVEVVDASKLWVNLVDHDKLAGSPRLLADLQRVMDGVPAADPSRGLLATDRGYQLPP